MASEPAPPHAGQNFRVKEGKLRLAVRFGTLLGLLIADSIAFGQTKTIDITVDDPRPMAAAVLKIEELSGIPINYEDVPVYYAPDMKYVTEEESRTRVSDKPFKPYVRVRGGQRSVSIAVDTAAGKLDVQAVKFALTNLILAYNSSRLPGAFDFEYHSGVFFVKPVRYRDVTGVTRAMAPVLSTPVPLPEGKRHWMVKSQLILQQVSKATGWLVGGDSGPLNAGEQTIGANNEPADHVMARVLAAIMCPGIGREGYGPVIAQTTWDGGYHYRLFYALPGWGSYLQHLLYVDRVPNSRWFVPPTPSKPYSPPTPRTGGLGAGTIKAR